MRALRFSPVVAVALLLAFTARPVRAQGFELGLGAGYYMLQGDDFEDTDSGLGLEAAFRYLMANRFQLGAALVRSSHGSDFAEGNIAVLQVLLEGRYPFTLTGYSVRPFIGGRAGIARSSGDFPTDVGTEVTCSASGFTFGALGGLTFPMSPRVALETSLSLSQVSFGDADCEDIGDQPNTDASGAAVGLRVGVIIGFPRAGRAGRR
jgi:hypothetical protein